MIAQDLYKVEPPNWWTGMENPNLQLLIYGKNISKYQPLINYKGVKIAKVNKVENPNYLFVDLIIDKETKPGIFNIKLQEGKNQLSYQYELKAKEKNPLKQKGFNAADVIYLIMPDRFSNGNPATDNVEGMSDLVNRNNPDGRHGGDIKGIRNHLDYIKDLGVTAIWLNPVLEANLKSISYHGYAISDFYKVDSRHGSNDEYKTLVDESHKNGLKVIMDMIFNHSASTHWFIQDMPSKDWVHQFPEFTRSNYRGEVASDPYASNLDKILLEKGWFDISMPDLNQENPFLARYLIQNSIWWVEYSGIDGIRMDTYPYPHQSFMQEWIKQILTEYPNFNVVGESWLQHVPTTAYWQKDFDSKKGSNTNLPSVTDFPFTYALSKSLNEPDSWTGGLLELYYILAQDFLYPNPNMNLIFADNHDLNRIYTTLNHNFNKYKMALSILATMRGIPQLYYGTEILIDGDGSRSHGYMRQDFPGGWDGDYMNAFKMENISQERKMAHDFVKKLLNWRKNKTVIHTGKLVHFIPENGTYVYFRYDDKEAVMVIINKSNSQLVPTAKYNEILKNYSSGRDVITNESISNLGNIYMEGYSARIIELEK